MMLVAHTLNNFNIKDRKLYLYDTFTGMTKPEKIDYWIPNNTHNPIEKWKNENNLEQGLKKTINWYKENKKWWKPLKNRVIKNITSK